MREPDLTGPRGRAWRLPPPETPGATPVARYLLNCPQAHPFWEWWVLSVVHLREQEGAPPPILFYPGATHELMVLSLDPERLPAPDPDAFPVPFPWLTPADVVAQFDVPTDADAETIAREGAEACVSGRLSPDSDYRRLWAVWLAERAAEVRAHEGDAREETP